MEFHASRGFQTNSHREQNPQPVVEQQIVGRDRLQIVVGQSHPWFEQAVVPVTELTTTAWVMREAGSGTRQQFEQVLRRWDIEPASLTVILEMKNGEMVKAAVESGVGAAAISDLVIVKELRLDLLSPIKVTGLSQDTTGAEPMSRPFLLLRHRERFQTRISRAFEQLLATS